MPFLGKAHREAETLSVGSPGSCQWELRGAPAPGDRDGRKRGAAVSPTCGVVGRATVTVRGGGWCSVMLHHPSRAVWCCPARGFLGGSGSAGRKHLAYVLPTPSGRRLGVGVMHVEGDTRSCPRQRRVAPEGIDHYNMGHEVRCLRSLSVSDTGRMSANQRIHKCIGAHLPFTGCVCSE